jgi:hypothetical protein
MPAFLASLSAIAEVASMEAHPSAQPVPPLVEGVSIYPCRVSPWLASLTLCCHRLPGLYRYGIAKVHWQVSVGRAPTTSAIVRT